MRRQQNEITDRNEIETILTRCTIGRLATKGGDGYPYITPVNYTYFDDSIYFHTAVEGEKLDNIKKDPKVCFEVDIPLAYLDHGFDRTRPACQVTQFFLCVIIRGRAEIVEDDREKVAALNSLMADHENQPAFSAITQETPALKVCNVMAVRIESISGKSNLAQKKTIDEQRRIAAYLQKRDLPGDRETARLITVMAEQEGADSMK